MDSVECFSSLAESVPPWVERVTDLVSHTTARHAEFAAEYSKLSSAGKRPSSSRKEKNSSVHTNRGEDDDGQPRSTTNKKKQQAERQEADHASSTDPLAALRLRQRQSSSRRNIGAAVRPRSPNNGPEQTRNRRHLVIRYDSHAQDALESLVRDIGGARNNIRKGRMDHMMKTGFGMKSALSASRDDPSKPIFRSSRSDLSKGPPAPQASPFDNVDKQLASAQNLCETAAYQLLRHGDCSMELNQTKGHLSTVLGTAQFELEKAKAEKEEAEREEAKKAEMKTEIEQPQDKKEETAPNGAPKKADKDPLVGTHAIEVDDNSDNSSVSIDFGAFRRSRRY